MAELWRSRGVRTTAIGRVQGDDRAAPPTLAVAKRKTAAELADLLRPRRRSAPGRSGLIALAVILLAPGPHRAEPGGGAGDLPSPDAMRLGAEIAPAVVVGGFRDAIVDAALDAALGGRAAADRAALRARARVAMGPLLDDAFPPELLAGLGAAFLSRRYTAEELAQLRARVESPLGQRLRALERSAVEGDTPEERERARAALYGRTFSRAEQEEIAAFEASPLGRKGLALAPDLAAAFLDGLDRRWVEVHERCQPRLRRAAEDLLAQER